ncbi:MAG: nucleotidyltransferase domain-containing protein [Terriglobia bacterium]
MDRLLDELVKRLARADGENLLSVALYGSAASGEFRPGHSDLNVLCLLRRIGPRALEQLHPAFRWWTKKGHPAPLVFTLEELRQAADVYAIELIEIKASHRLLFGEDVFGSLQAPTELHSLQVERELRHNLTRLRQSAIAVAGRKKDLLELMLRSASTFALLFRHCLIALGEAPPPTKREAVERLAALLGFDAKSFRALFKVRTGGMKKKEVNVPSTFASYLEAVTHATEEMDRRLARDSGK